MTNSTTAGFGDYLELTKPRLSMLSVLTTLIGYVAARPPWLPVEFISLIIGTCLAAGGVATLNQWLEADTDAKMRRTADRPIPSGKIPTGSAFVLGALMCGASLGLMFIKVNGMATLFTLITMISYVGWYTPAKRSSRWSTEIGWSAAEAGVSALGWVLFGILVFWQIPHFMAIAWTYRHDYAAVDFPMLSVRDENGGWVAGWSFINALLLLAVSVVPAFLGLTSNYYLIVAGLTGLP
jgi:heme o synthase